jgi:hypothetical protein
VLAGIAARVNTSRLDWWASRCPSIPLENLRGRGHRERQGCAREAEFHRREHHSHNAAANRYIVEIMKGALSQNQKIDVALAYRLMRDASL